MVRNADALQRHARESTKPHRPRIILVLLLLSLTLLLAETLLIAPAAAAIAHTLCLQALVAVKVLTQVNASAPPQLRARLRSSSLPCLNELSSAPGLHFGGRHATHKAAVPIALPHRHILRCGVGGHDRLQAHST